MKPSGRRALMVIATAAACLAAFSARAEAPMATAPEECVFYSPPIYKGVDCDMDRNLFLMANGNSIRAFDTHTGAERWHRSKVSWKTQTLIRLRNIAAYWEGTLVLLDKTTGKEIWQNREMRYGDIFSIWDTADHSAMLVSYSPSSKEGIPVEPPAITYVLYRLDNTRPRVFANLQDAFCAGMLADGKTAVFGRVKGEYKPAHSLWDDHGLKEYFLLDLETGTTTEPHVIPGSDRCWRVSVSSSGLLAVTKFPQQKGPIGLIIFDARTGSLVRDLGQKEEAFVSVEWTGDEKSLYFTTLDDPESKMCVIDAQTGETLRTFSKPGHEIVEARIQQTDQGPDVLLTRDKDRNFWYWPLAEESSPVKVFDGLKIAPGHNVVLQGFGKLSTHEWQSESKTVSAYEVAGLKKTAGWNIPRRSNTSEDEWFNQTMSLCVNRITDFSKNGRVGKEEFEVYGAGTESVLFAGKGSPCALSPDGHFMVVKTTDKQAVLEDLKEEKAVHAFDSGQDWDIVANAVFSEDGRRVAVNVYPNLEVVDLTDGFPRRKMAPENGQQGIMCVDGMWNYGRGQGMCFSPDGSLLLTGEYGRALLHDAATGRLLHTFKESGRFYRTQSYGRGGFLQSLEQTALDWAGLVTDRYKSFGSVHVAFSGLGTRAVTCAEGQVIRVWDVQSGDQINVIETGLPEKRNKNSAINNRIILSDNADYALAVNDDNFAPASLWSLADGALIRRYRFPERPFSGHNFGDIAVADDGTAIHVLDNGDLYRWPGRPVEAP